MITINTITHTRQPIEFIHPSSKNSKILPIILIIHPHIPSITNTNMPNNTKRINSILYLFNDIYNIELIQ